MSERDKGYPMRGYVYTPDGYHDGGVWLDNEKQLDAFMRGTSLRAFKMGLEVRVTDNLDYMIFHAKNGEVLWPNATNTPPE